MTDEERRRAAMVREQLLPRGIDDPSVLAAMGRVPRHEFVPEPERALAYADHPLPIGFGQTISQPYIVALMTQLAGVSGRPGARVLEVGTGCGYQAAVLAELGAEVWTVEIVEPLARRAAATLARLGYDRVHVRVGDGYAGWPEEAPFDAILVAAAAPRLPEPLLAQLAPGGRLVIPVGEGTQILRVITKSPDGETRAEDVAAVRFVPMTGQVRRAGGSEEPPEADPETEPTS